MPEQLAQSLERAIHSEFPHLQKITEHQAGERPAPGKWSQKEELGHLVDSASNNHQRFVRASAEPNYRGPGYQQDIWVATHGYQEMAWADLLEFWKRYNLFLARLVRRLPDKAMPHPCVVGESRPVTLQFLIEDYVLHMQHHLDHILQREKITSYPGAALGV
ncbi:MAG TPA: DinB family protein [Bryobacteraceae bacterium]|nr:DinB family protein [Bryobacteraceae bacterium]